MTDQPSVDLAGLVVNLLQQQTALLQVQSESVRLQRLLVERLLGDVQTATMAPSLRQTDPLVSASTEPLTVPAPLPEPSVRPAPQETLVVSVPRLEASGKPAADAPPAPAMTPAVSGPPIVESGTAREVAVATGDGGNAAYAARYYRAPPAVTFAPVQPQNLELLRLLREMRDASGLILQFGLHKGETLGQVAINDPDYVRQLVIRAQRPEVRSAAGRLVEALDAAAAHKPRTARAVGRRSRAAT
jgi:hypothetical protein